jgi:hypothetical protein
MTDPRRLRSDSRSPEALLLRSAPRLEPPPTAQGEVWRRLEAAAVIGAAPPPAAKAVVGSKIAGKALWLGLGKWGAVVAIGASAIGSATFYAARSKRVEAPPAATAPVAATPRAPEAPLAPAPSEPAPATHRALRPEPASSSAASSLRAEAAMLGVAREKLSAGDDRGALDEVAKLGARFPHGALSQEREVVALGALAGLGDRQALSTRATAFLQRYPESPYAAHVRRLVER